MNIAPVTFTLVGNELANDRWFRIPERDAVPTKIDKSLIGTFWKTKNVVTRIGYRYEPMDFRGLEGDVAKEIMASTIRSQLFELDDSAKDKVSKRVLDSLVEEYGRGILPKFRARGKMLNEIMHKHPDKGIRAVWYDRWPDANYAYRDAVDEWQWVMLTGVKRGWTGKYYPPSGGYFDGDWDYEPGGLSEAVYHSVYTAEIFCEFGSPARFDKEHFEMWGRECMVHPADLFDRKEDA